MVLLDGNGEVLTPPVCYLDGQLKGASQRLENLGLSGFSNIHSICQLTVLPGEIIKNCACLLHIADYINYRLSGVARGNYSMYSVGKLLDTAGNLHRELLDKLDIPTAIFPEVCSEQVIGKLDNSWPDILQNVPVISGISHDTAAAFYSLAPQKNEVAVIFGTWLMCGVLQDAAEPLPQSGKVMGINYQYSARHASAPGLWAFNQCVEAWKKQGVFPGFAEFDAAVNASDYSGSFQAAWSDKPLLPEDVAKSLLEQGASLPQCLRERAEFQRRYKLRGESILH
jgi:sugar (pentulose or hexulose) kinase